MDEVLGTSFDTVKANSEEERDPRDGTDAGWQP